VLCCREASLLGVAHDANPVLFGVPGRAYPLGLYGGCHERRGLDDGADGAPKAEGDSWQLPETPLEV
jgi:hypothetical protein